MKGRPPLYDEETRVRTLRDQFPDYHVVLGGETDRYACVCEYHPHVLAFGYDQQYDGEEITRLFSDVRQVVIGAYHPETYKSSLMKERLGRGE